MVAYEVQDDGSLVELNLRGRFLGNVGGIDQFEDISLLSVGDPLNTADYLPLPPSVSVVLSSRTVAVVTITPPTNPPPRSAILEYRVYRSTNSTTSYSLVQTVPAGPAPSWTNTGLPTATPENTFRYYVTAVNTDGEGQPSNVATVQWAGTPLQQPTAPTGLGASGLQATQVNLSWTETADATVTKHGIFSGTTLLVDNIPAAATSYTWTGLTPQTAYSINVRRYNGYSGGTPAGWSPASNTATFTTPSTALGPLFLGHVRGRIYLGWSTNHDETAAQTQLNTQTPLLSGTNPNYSDLLGVRRLYNKVSSTITHTDNNNRVLWISAKGDELGAATGLTGWQQIGSGSRDANIVSYFNSLVARNKLTIFTFHHEPIGDFPSNGADHVAAHLRIMQVVDANFPGHRIIFCPNYEENRLRNTNGGTINWATWLPESMLPGKGGPRPWDFISFDMYQYNANTSTSATAGVQFSHRWWRIDQLFTGQFRPTGTSVMPYMTYTPGVDITFGLGECAMRPGAFWDFENGGPQPSNMTGAKYSRDMLDYIFANVDKFAFVSWFNSIGADLNYNDERLYPGPNTWGGKTPAHDHRVQTGDTELTLNIYREKLRSGLPIKLASNGLPPA